MAGTKIEQLRSAARQLVTRLDADDRLQIVPFSGNARPAWDGLRPAHEANRQEAYDVLDDLAATGSTNIEAALRASTEDLQEAPDRGGPRVQAVALLSDGKPTAGAESTDALRRIVREEGPEAQSVFALAFGDDADRGLTYALAEETDGYAKRVPADGDAEVDLRRFFRNLATPVLRDVSVSYEGDVTSYRVGSPVLFRRNEILVVGQFDPSTPGTLEGTITASGVNGSHEASFSEPVEAAGTGDGLLPRLVAYQRIQSLQAEIDATGGSPQLVDEVQSTALEYGFVTDHTSLVVTLPSQDDAAEMRDRRVEPRPDDASADEAPARGGAAHGGAGVPLLPGSAPVAVAGVLAAAALGLRRSRRPP
jgi:uncharacterized protein YegL